MLIIYDKSVSFDRSDTNMFFDSLGYGVLTDLVSDPLITEELNGSYILEFEYKKDGKLSEYLVEENIIKAHGEPFSIYSIDKKINNRISVLARHWVLNEWDKDFLIDVAPTKLSAYNALKWIQERSVNKSNINISGNCENISSARYVNKTMLESIFKEDNAILTKFGGELSYSKNNVFINNRRGSLSGLTIRQGKNISGAEYYLDFTTVTTRLVPVGKDGLMLPNKFVDSPLINNYATPIVRKIEVDTDNITELENYCNKLYESGLDKPTISVKIDFVELSKTTEYKKYSSLETAHLGDTVVAYIPSLGLNFSTRIVKTVYNDNLKRITSIELGTIMPNIAINNVKIQNSISQIANLKSSILAKAKQDASSLIKHPFEGYLYIDDSTGTLYIMDTNDISTAKNIWRWGLGGLGFSSTGIDGTYGIAITQDGKIVADYILTGTLSADRIEGYNELLLNVSSINTQIIPTSTTSGSNIHIEDSSDKKMVNFEIEGKSEQVTRSGKNLFNKENNIVKSNVSPTKTVLDTGVRIVYNYSGGHPFALIEIGNLSDYLEKTMRIKTTGVPSSSNRFAVGFYIANDDYSTIQALGNSSYYYNEAEVLFEHTLENSYDSTYTKLLVGLRTASTTSTSDYVDFTNLIITSNNSNMDYEPYGVMPSPDYPSEIESVGYENLVEETLTGMNINNSGQITRASFDMFIAKVEKDKTYTISVDDITGVVCGFFTSKPTLYSISYNNSRLIQESSMTIIAPITGYIAFRGTSGYQYAQLTEGQQQHSYIPYGKYGIEVKNTGKNLFDKNAQGLILGKILDRDGTIANSGGYAISDYIPVRANKNYYQENFNSYYSCYYDKNKKYLGVCGTQKFTPSQDGYIRTSLLKTNLDIAQITQNTVATDYEPYKSTSSLFVLDQPLRSLPNGVKDIAYIKNNILCVDRKVGSKIFDGSEDWVLQETMSNGKVVFRQKTLFLDSVGSSSRGLCNYLPFDNTVYSASNNKIGFYFNEFKVMNFVILSTTASTINEFKTWLSTHNTQVDYELAEPYIEKIGEVEIPSTFKGVNNITTTDELEPVMNIEYVRDTILSDYVEGQVNSSQVTLRNEMNAKFVLQQENIDLELSKKVNDNEIIASINMSTEKMEDGSSMQIQADKLNLKGKKFNLTTDEITIESENFSVSKDGKISAKSGEIGGFKIETDKFSNSISETYNFTENDYTKVKNYIMETENLTDEEIELYDINGDGKVSSSDYVKIKNMVNGLISNIINGTLEINSKSSKRTIVLRDSEGKIVTSLGLNGSTTPSFSCDEFYIGSEKQPSIQSGTSLPTEVKDGVVFLLYDE